MKCNKQFKHSNYVTLSRFHRTTVNNSGIEIKEQLLRAMEQVNDMSRKSASDSGEISTAIEGQAAEVEKILANMEIVRNGMNCLADVLNRNRERKEITE